MKKQKPRSANPLAATKASSPQLAKRLGKDPRTIGIGFTPNLKPKGPFSPFIRPIGPQRPRSSMKFISTGSGRWTYPASLLEYDTGTDTYHYTKVAAHLLSIVSGVPTGMILTTTVQRRQIGRYRPFYNASRQPGGITLGPTNRKNITYTENYFAKEGYNGYAYGSNIREWLSISAHEVGHLPQIDREGNLIAYLMEFVRQYATISGHDDAPYEIEAEKGRTNFELFYEYINQKYGYRALENMLINQYLSDQTKIERLSIWWSGYKRHMK